MGRREGLGYYRDTEVVGPWAVGGEGQGEMRGRELCGNFIYLLAVDVQASSVRGLLATSPYSSINLDPYGKLVQLG